MQQRLKSSDLLRESGDSVVNAYLKQRVKKQVKRVQTFHIDLT